MNKKDKALMEKHDITSMSRKVFFYKDFKYENLKSAVRYAEHDTKEIAPATPDIAGL